MKVHLFVGCVLSPELKLSLQQSDLWKQEPFILNRGEAEHLLITPYQQKEYVGVYVGKKNPTLDDLHKKEERVLELLTHFCGIEKCQDLKAKVFPLVMIS